MKTYPVDATSTPLHRHGDISTCLKDALSTVAITWPLDAYNATNPLDGWEHLPFDIAVKNVTALRGGHGLLPLASYYNFYTSGRITHSDLDSVISDHLQSACLSLPDTLNIGDQSIPVVTIIRHWIITAATREHLIVRTTEQIRTRGERVSTPEWNIIERVNEHVSKWCAAFFDPSQASWSMPYRERGLYASWKVLALHEHHKRVMEQSGIKHRLQDLPETSEMAVVALLECLQIPRSEWTLYLARHCAHLPGWAGYIRWLTEYGTRMSHAQNPVSISDYLAMRLFYETEYVEYTAHHPPGCPGIWTGPWSSESVQASTFPGRTIEDDTQTIERLLASIAGDRAHSTLSLAVSTHLAKIIDYYDAHRQAYLWQEAYEYHSMCHLQAVFHTPSDAPSPLQTVPPDVQFLFCIDARSERLRRHIEAQGRYATYGVAGFFGLPVRFYDSHEDTVLDLCPAGIQPEHVIIEQRTENSTKQDRQRYNAKDFLLAVHDLFHKIREHLLAPFVFVEAIGWILLLPFVFKTIAPRHYARWRSRSHALLTRSVSTTFDFATGSHDLAGISIDQQAVYVAQMLRMIGLTESFASLIVICGHGSDSVNNPHASALDCGACGGHSGSINARLAVTILNNPAVRIALVRQGIVIPASTFFLAAAHITTTDQITILTHHNVIPSSHQDIVKKMIDHLHVASIATVTERLQTRNATETNPVLHAHFRASDWAQTRPEWGLAGNALFLCGRRSWIQGRNFAARAFLHSYDPVQDPQGLILESILVAPLIVAAGINLHYYFARVDNQSFGSGTKLLHSIIGQFGVVQGQGGDLMSGLPIQSIMDGGQFIHEPKRLIAVIEAPCERIDRIISRQPKLRQLLDNVWLKLVACDPTTGRWYRYSGHGVWKMV